MDRGYFGVDREAGKGLIFLHGHHLGWCSHCCPGRLADKTYLNAMLFPYPLCCHRPQRLCEVRHLFYDVQASHGEVCGERGTRHLCPHNWDPIKLGWSDEMGGGILSRTCHQRFPAATRYSVRRDPSCWQSKAIYPLRSGGLIW